MIVTAGVRAIRCQYLIQRPLLMLNLLKRASAKFYVVVRYFYDPLYVSIYGPFWFCIAGERAVLQLRIG